MLRQTRESQGGFSLLELLVVTGLFALLGLGTALLLHSSINLSERAKARNEQLRAMDDTVQLLRMDVQQALTFTRSSESPGQGKVLLTLVRPSPWQVLNAQAGLETVRYRLLEQQLVRESRMSADDRGPWQQQLLLTDVSHFSLTEYVNSQQRSRADLNAPRLWRLELAVAAQPPVTLLLKVEGGQHGT